MIKREKRIQIAAADGGDNFTRGEPEFAGRVQGGPLVHTIAAKAVCLKEAMEPSFKSYQQQVVANAKALANAIAKAGFPIVAGGTDNHVFLMEVHSRGITGSDAEKALDRAGITVNKNAIPFDPLPPMKAGGIRLGSPSVTTRGMKEPEMELIGAWVAEVLSQWATPPWNRKCGNKWRNWRDGFRFTSRDCVDR